MDFIPAGGKDSGAKVAEGRIGWTPRGAPKCLIQILIQISAADGARRRLNEIARRWVAPAGGRRSSSAVKATES